MNEHNPKAVRYILWSIVVIAVLIGAGMMIAVRAHAQVLCGPADQVEANLIQAGGKLAADLKLRTDTAGGLIQMRIFANPKTGKWALVTLSSDGTACLVMVGEGWSPARLPGKDA